MNSSISNSTKMELTAAIIATHAPRPITIAIDNQAVVEGFKRIKDKRDKSTRWINKPDGDLWQFWVNAIVAGGVETTSVKWIPGHQTEQDEDNGKISRYDRRSKRHCRRACREREPKPQREHGQIRARDSQEEQRVSEACASDTQAHAQSDQPTQTFCADRTKDCQHCRNEKKTNIAIATFHIQSSHKTRNIRFTHDRPP